MECNLKDNYDDNEIITFLFKNGVFSEDLVKQSLENFTFTEFTLQELGLPDYQTILKSVLTVKEKVGIQGWVNNGQESPTYKGFSITYNPDFYDKDVSIYHQTWGSKDLTQGYGRIHGLGNHDRIKNTYYDTYAFRKMHPDIERDLGFLLKRFKCPIFRSRAAFFSPDKITSDDGGWHVDEPPCQLLRINIPLRTHPNFVLEINGTDEFGNSLNLQKHLEVGKAYIWNTRIPHRIKLVEKLPFTFQRIHLVLGLAPWVSYNADNDSFSKSELHGMPIQQIVEEKLFVRSFA